MESQTDLTRLSTPKLRNERKRQEKRHDALRTEFPYLTDGTASLAARYAGGPEWDAFAETQSRLLEIKLELIRRGEWNPSPNFAAPQGEPESGENMSPSKRRSGPTPSKKGDPDVAKRRAIVKSDPNVPASELCGTFDPQSVPLPAKWTGAGLKSWTEAYKHREYRRRIDVHIAKNKKND